MAPSDGWYLFGPLLAVGVVALIGFAFWRMGLQWIEQAEDPLGERYDELSIFADEYAEADDFGLLCAAVVADDPAEADQIRLLLAEAGIRATAGMRRDGRVAVLVFAEELEAARRTMPNS